MKRAQGERIVTGLAPNHSALMLALISELGFELIGALRRKRLLR